MNFLELVPRDQESFLAQSHNYLTRYPELTGINVPDVKRIDIRSEQAVTWLLDQSITAIPHIRTQDKSIDDHITQLNPLLKKGLQSILLISGDPIKDNPSPLHEVTPIDLTKAIKATFPQLKVYCGIDPYRQPFEKELNYANKKIAAGADGLFSQPFFDTELAQKYMNEFQDNAFFLGISPVITDRSQHYWARVNKVTFPENFEPNLDYAIQVSRELKELANNANQHVYFMPIKTPVQDYLDGVFA